MNGGLQEREAIKTAFDSQIGRAGYNFTPNNELNKRAGI